MIAMIDLSSSGRSGKEMLGRTESQAVVFVHQCSPLMNFWPWRPRPVSAVLWNKNVSIESRVNLQSKPFFIVTAFKVTVRSSGCQ